MNPTSRVPTIVEDDGFTLWESNANIQRPSHNNIEAYSERLAQGPAFQKNVMIPLS